MIVTERFSLDPYYKRIIRQWEPKFGFGLLGAVVYHRTYSRMKNDGSQESWADTVIRVIEGMLSIRKWWYITHKLPWDEEYWQDLGMRMATTMYQMKWLPPGRGLQVGGTDFVYRTGALAHQNCFSGDTLALTDTGAKPLKSLVGQRVRVLTTQGWREAEVRYFGRQPLQAITFVSAYRNQGGTWTTTRGMRHVIRATPDHRWILADGRETTALRVGDVVPAVVDTVADVASEQDRSLYEQGLVHGLVFADGVKHRTRQDGKYVYDLRLRESTSRYLNIVGSYGTVSFDDTTTVRILDHRDLTKLPTDNTPAPYLRGFLDGWLASDSSPTKSGSVSRRLSSRDHKALAWFINHAPLAGLVVTGYAIDRETEMDGDRHQAPRGVVTYANAERGWVVTKIEEGIGEGDVYCAVVPEVGAFTLAGGIYTGNCGACSIRKLSRDAAWVMNALMHGTGVGFDTYAYTDRLYLPHEETEVFVIPDSREGWCDSVRLLIESYEKGSKTVVFDYSQIRPAGAPIRGFGGVASGPEPLKKLHEQLRPVLASYARGEISSVRLVTDVINLIGTCVVAGGVRRTAEIALGLPHDQEFLKLKDFSRYDTNGNLIYQGSADDRRAWGWTSNNSIQLFDHDDFRVLPDVAEQIRLNGEPGLLNMINVRRYGRMGEERPDTATLINPCGEQPLEDKEVCCLADVFVNNCESDEEFFEAVEFATTYASTIALLPTCDEDTNLVIARNRRIGVSISAIAEWLTKEHPSRVITLLRKGYRVAEETNLRLAREAGVAPSIRFTTVKPNGSTSQLAGASPGLHFPPYGRYIRRVRVQEQAPIVELLVQAGVPHEPDLYSDNTLVFEFPVDLGKVRGQRDVSMWEKGAIARMMQRHWSNNAVSVTVTFDPKTEGDQVEKFLALNMPDLKTISMLPDEEAVYPQMPYEPITLKEYEERVAKIKPIDWSKLAGSEVEPELYCNTDRCEI